MGLLFWVLVSVAAVLAGVGLCCCLCAINHKGNEDESYDKD